MSTFIERLHARRILANHKEKRTNIPDLVSMGIVKRKLTRKESKRITQEVMDLGLKNPDSRVSLAIIKAIETTR